MMRTGNRAIPESYDGGNSHPAYTAFADWLFESVTGLAPDIESPGFTHFFVRPQPAGDLTWARGRHESLHGTIESSWRIADGVFTLNVTAPPNTSATVTLPAGAEGPVTESGAPVADASGVAPIAGPGLSFRIEAGRYSFSSPWDPDAQKRAGLGESSANATSTDEQSGEKE
jgi:alpha-L-rhamnosidase